MPYNVFVHDLFLKLRSIVWISIEKLVYELKLKGQYERNDVYSDMNNIWIWYHRKTNFNCLNVI
jgi:hypothetical protein